MIMNENTTIPLQNDGIDIYTEKWYSICKLIIKCHCVCSGISDFKGKCNVIRDSISSAYIMPKALCTILKKGDCVECDNKVCCYTYQGEVIPNIVFISQLRI